ncbi:YceD family protein [Desertibaculum subflavum]|uniref:YceD family protein n=1 Tax=Desertibaculum subflavum TaxID=2268458 RepID=UPI0013C494F6
MGSSPPHPEFGRPVEVSRIGPSGLSLAIEADPAERERLARRLGLGELRRLHADLALQPRGAGIALTATWTAEVVQDCVVTLDPVVSELGDTFELAYGPAAEAEAAAEIELDLDVADPPEPIEGGRIDVGEAVVEQLALAIDPYPRKPGVEFVPPADETEMQENPFAALGGLKGRR